MLNFEKCVVLLLLYSTTATYNKNKDKCLLVDEKKCVDSRYRTIDGSCNNLFKKTFGQSRRPYGRLTKPTYCDGSNGIPKQTDGTPYPSARVISNVLFPPGNRDSKVYTLALMQFAQLIAHDMVLGEASRNPVGCCTSGKLGPASNQDTCSADILIPPKDPDYSNSGIQCFGFGRTRTTADYFCDQKSYYEQINLATSFLDLSFIYGSTMNSTVKLREYSGGRLRGVMRNGVLWPPNAETNCVRAKSPFSTCYLFGDPRANQNPQLISVHILMWREHNRIVDILQKYKPSWNDESLFQEARRICIAEWQHFVYTEILPKLLGANTMHRYGLINKNPKSCLNDYKPSVDLSTLQEFATGAFRYFHTLIPGKLNTDNYKQEFLKNRNLSDWIYNEAVNKLNSQVNYDTILIGLTMQPQAEADNYYTEEIKCRFATTGNSKLGLDLISLDIERARDHGLARYVDIRRLCKLSVPKTWEDMVGDLSTTAVYKLRKLYANVESVEYLPASNLENLLPGALVGPTYACIIGLQFKLTRTGDRYFYDNCERNKLSSEQLAAIKKVPLARLFCENSIIQKVQRSVTEIISCSNPQVDCSNIPSLDLTLWKNKLVQTYHGKRHQFFSTYYLKNINVYGR